MNKKKMERTAEQIRVDKEDTNVSRGLFLRAALILLLVVGSAVILYFTPLREYLHEVGRVQETLERTGHWAPVIFIFMTAVLIIIGVPRLLICPIAGAVFGFLWGLVISQIGTVLGAYLTFLFVRWGGRDFVLRHWPKLQNMTTVFSKRGVASVFLARQLPLGGIFVNLILGLTPVTHRAFLVGTALGIIPEAVRAVLVGAGAIEMMGNGRSVMKPLLSVISLMVVWFIVFEFLKRSRLAALLFEKIKVFLKLKGSTE